LAVLKHIVDFLTMLIGVEGASLLREKRAGETPQAQSAKEAPGSLAESERSERKSTVQFNRALFLKEEWVWNC
jgi:hypothetical protein